MHLGLTAITTENSGAVIRWINISTDSEQSMFITPQLASHFHQSKHSGKGTTAVTARILCVRSHVTNARHHRLRLIYQGGLQERCSNLHSVECHSTEWRLEWLILSCNICVDSSWLETVFCVLAMIFTLSVLKPVTWVDSTVDWLSCNPP